MTVPRTGTDTYVPGHGDRRWSATAYTLELDYKVATNHLSGWAHVDVQLAEAGRDIELDLYGLRVSSVLIDGQKAKNYSHNGSRLKVTLRPDGGDRIRLSVAYAGKPRPMPGPDGRAGWEELTDGVLVGSQPHGAPSWFPCNDRADDKAPYRIAMSVESGYHLVGNGALVDKRTRSGRTTWTYEQREPMAPYLACVQIGRYAVTHLTAQPVPVDVVAPAGARIGAGSAFEHQGAMVTAMSAWFGPYPFGAYRAVVAADTFEIPLEAQGLASFGINHVTPAWENERLVAHELAHSWFGNSLTARSWADIWLHEGFACYSEWLWAEHRGMRSVEDQAREQWKRLSRLPQDLVIGAPGADRMFDDRVYKRGALTVHALRLALGDESFFAAVRAWTAAHAYGVVTTPDLIAHFGSVEAPADRAVPQVDSIIQTWVYAAPLPELG
ncbi:MAG: M1 family metallopeptidase [Tetrasphaera sp.]|nr:M1 family metallopeptidase [Tetrasphaera sp.]